MSKQSTDAFADSGAGHLSLPVTPLWVVVGLAMGPAVALGLARFAYALLLPAMRADLGWSFAAAGGMNTANAVGYLAGALTATPVGAMIGTKHAFASCLLLTVLAIAAAGLSADFGVLLFLRFAAGYTGAVTFVIGSRLAAAAAGGGSEHRVQLVLGLHVAGAGLGIAASALAVPPLLSAAGWRGGWLALGGVGLVATAFGWTALGRLPDPSRTGACRSVVRGGDAWSPRGMARLLGAYSMFGAGYIAYATFIIAYLRGADHFADGAITLFWVLLGGAAVVAAFAWSPALARLRGGRGAAATIGTVTAGAALPLFSSSSAIAYLSALLFGGSFLAVIAAVTSFARRTAPQSTWTSAIAALTVAFGLGQCIGPVLSGALSDGSAGVQAGLWLSVAIVAISSFVALLQPEPTSLTQGAAVLR